MYTQHYNRFKHTDGPLFRGRYKAINIEASSYLLEVSRYIHRNPLETSKPLIDCLVDYRWSSYPAFCNESNCPQWLYRDAIFAELSSGHSSAAYGRFVEQGLDEETEMFYSKNQWPAVRGEKAFVDSAYLHALSVARGVSQHREVVPLEQIVTEVACYFECDESRILRASRGRGKRHLERWVAMKLARDLTGESMVALSGKFGVKAYSTMSMTISRLNKILADDADLAATYNSISEALTP